MSADERLAIAALEKLPRLDLTWSLSRQDQWWSWLAWIVEHLPKHEARRSS